MMQSLTFRISLSHCRDLVASTMEGKGTHEIQLLFTLPLTTSINKWKPMISGRTEFEWIIEACHNRNHLIAVVFAKSSLERNRNERKHNKSRPNYFLHDKEQTRWLTVHYFVCLVSPARIKIDYRFVNFKWMRTSLVFYQYEKVLCSGMSGNTCTSNISFVFITFSFVPYTIGLYQDINFYWALWTWVFLKELHYGLHAVFRLPTFAQTFAFCRIYFMQHLTVELAP